MAYLDNEYCKAHTDEFENEIKKLKANSFYCEVAYRDFKGRESVLQRLETSIKSLGIKTKGYDYEDSYKGWAVVPSATKEDIKELHKRYKGNLSIEWCGCDDDSYEECLKYVLDRRDKRVKQYEELIERGKQV